MDHELIGLWALRSKLKKDKVLSQDPAVTQAIASELEVAPMSDEDEVITLVRNRFLSSKTLASDVSAAATALRAMLHPQDDAAAEAETSTRTTTHEEAPIRKKTKIVKEARPLGDGDEDDVQHPEEGQTMEVAAEQEDEDDGWESGSVADSDGESDSSTTGRKGKVTATSKSATSSTFLPSLSVGFIRGESDSDYSDEEKEDVAEPKKNRRGQRARRAYVFLHLMHLLPLTNPFPPQHLGEKVRQERQSRREGAPNRLTTWQERLWWPTCSWWQQPSLQRRSRGKAQTSTSRIWFWRRATSVSAATSCCCSRGVTSVLGGEAKAQGEAKYCDRASAGQKDYIHLASLECGMQSMYSRSMGARRSLRKGLSTAGNWHEALARGRSPDCKLVEPSWEGFDWRKVAVLRGTGLHDMNPLGGADGSSHHRPVG